MTREELEKLSTEELYSLSDKIMNVIADRRVKANSDDDALIQLPALTKNDPNFISLVKQVRESCGCGLRDAATYVEKGSKVMLGYECRKSDQGKLLKALIDKINAGRP
jgi:ribosomal protein L7/L12